MSHRKLGSLIVLIALCVLCLGSMGGCQTIKGIGADIANFGEAMDSHARSSERYSLR